MSIGSKYPKTLVEAVRYFSDPETALNFFVKIRWPHGITCPQCGSEKVSYLKNQHRWQCSTKHPKRQFSAKVGTIFEESPLPLEHWLVAVWLEVNAKNSISSYEIARALGITQKSAWFMLHRVRHALHVGSFDKKLSGVIEADETYIGGLAKNMHAKRRKEIIKRTGVHDKATVVGLLERHDGKKHSTVRAAVIKDTSHASLYPVIHKNVEHGATLYTDALQSYRKLSADYVHEFVDHAEAYVRGAVHTNGLENFWALFKRCIKGTHVSIEPFHLEAYVDSEAFRFNHREVRDGDRFMIAMPGVVGKRLMYKTLTGKDQPEVAQEIGNGNTSGSGAASDLN